jgi:hypothetical protein
VHVIVVKPVPVMVVSDPEVLAAPPAPIVIVYVTPVVIGIGFSAVPLPPLVSPTTELR